MLVNFVTDRGSPPPLAPLAELLADPLRKDAVTHYISHGAYTTRSSDIILATELVVNSLYSKMLRQSLLRTLCR